MMGQLADSKLDQGSMDQGLCTAVETCNVGALRLQGDGPRMLSVVQSSVHSIYNIHVLCEVAD